MPALDAVVADDYGAVVLNALARLPRGTGGLCLELHKAYRTAVEECRRKTLLRRLKEELSVEPALSVAQFGAELGVKEDTLGRWMNGSREYPYHFPFALEWWLPGVCDYLPFADGVLEAARADGLCGAIAFARLWLGRGVAVLAPADYWQLHHMYGYVGWQGTPRQSPRGFEQVARAASARAAAEYANVHRATERTAPPLAAPRAFAELQSLDDEWGLPYLLARMCLSTDADDALVADERPAGERAGAFAGSTATDSEDDE